MLAWSLDGEPLVDPPDGDDRPGVFRRNLNAWQSAPALADLTGDGKAEIIVIDDATRSIRAWSGDGRGVGEDDGILARLPGPARGVSIADLGGDGVIDLFAGSCWIRYTPGQTPLVTQLLDEPPADTYWTQPTIGDVDRDGLAEVIFGLNDGRVFVRHTGLAYAPRWIEWPTSGGNFQRTGEWKPPARR